MTERSSTEATGGNDTSLSSRSEPGVAARHRAERRFRRYGQLAIGSSLVFLAFFLLSILFKGYGAFFETAIKVDIDLSLAALNIESGFTLDDLAHANYRSAVRAALREFAPDISGRREKKALYGLIGAGAAFELRDRVVANPSLVGTKASLWLTASDDVGLHAKGHPSNLGSKQQDWFAALDAAGRIKKRFSFTFLTAGDSRDPEVAGVWGAVKGTAFSLFVCLVLAFFVGVLAAIYLEEFAPKNRWTHMLEININNLAAVPSITFGLLGLAIFLGYFGLPRSASLVGGMVLALMTLPTIIISSRISLQAVPPSIREAALGLGASHIQAVFHHVFPLALPGMLTGTIIGMARAMGETAPLLMIGMVAFIADPPSTFLDPASALPVQVYLWADSPERAFAEKTAGAIIVLLALLIAMNLAAIVMRRKFEKSW